MCGIAAVIGNVEEDSMQRALKAMKHRGPDGQKIRQFDNNAILGHCRLAVRGKLNDSQPITNRFEDLAIVVNGEFYNDIEIRKKLEKKGHIFRTDLDSEIALHSFEENGLSAIHDLRGEFAFIIWDGSNKRLIAVRDRFGIKPLCFAQAGEAWMVASEAKAIFAAKFKHPAWNINSIFHCLAHQYLPPAHTMFDGVSMIPPSHYAIFQQGKNPIIKRYWTPPYREGQVDPIEIRSSIEEAVAMRLDSRIEPVFSLSSGIDSSAVVSIASRILGKNVKAFSVSFPDGRNYNEIQSVINSGEKIGANINPVSVSRESMVLELEDAVTYSEGLAINGQLVAKFLLSKAIHEAGHNVVLSGEGADEGFLGYAHLQMDADKIGQANFEKQGGVMLPSKNYPLFSPPSWLMKWPSYIKAKIEFSSQYQEFLNSDFDQEKHVKKWLECIRLNSSVTFPKLSAFMWINSALSNYILRTLGDGAEMSHSVEGRVPFLDHKLFEMAAQIPTNLNITDDGAKMILREALRGLLPENIRIRPKHPFLAPPLLQEPANTRVKIFVSDAIQSSKLPFFNRKKLVNWFEKLQKSADSSKRKADPVLMTVLSMIMMQKAFRL